MHNSEAADSQEVPKNRQEVPKNRQEVPKKSS